MKIVIVGWRPWSVVQRYKSLIVNAKKLGHQVVGIALEHYGNRPMTISLFRNLGVPVGSLNQFHPDAVFGECFWNAEENAARVWARRARKKYFVLDHSKMSMPNLACYNNKKPPNITLAVNEKNAYHLNKEFGVQAVPVGYPNFDVDYEVDVDKVRRELGVTNQPMIALFPSPTTEDRAALERERERLFPFLVLAEKRGWKVFAHLHPDTQSGKFRYTSSGHPCYELLMALQDRGVIFVSNFPGDFNGIIFNSCGPMALDYVADIVGGTCDWGPIFQAYVAAKKYFWMGDGEGNSDRHPNLVKGDAGYESIIRALGENAVSFERHPAYVKRWFYKLDGKCWMRMLAVAEATRRR